MNLVESTSERRGSWCWCLLWCFIGLGVRKNIRRSLKNVTFKIIWFVVDCKKNVTKLLHCWKVLVFIAFYKALITYINTVCLCVCVSTKNKCENLVNGYNSYKLLIPFSQYTIEFASAGQQNFNVQSKKNINSSR